MISVVLEGLELPLLYSAEVYKWEMSSPGGSGEVGSEPGFFTALHLSVHQRGGK